PAPDTRTPARAARQDLRDRLAAVDAAATRRAPRDRPAARTRALVSRYARASSARRAIDDATGGRGADCAGARAPRGVAVRGGRLAARRVGREEDVLKRLLSRIGLDRPELRAWAMYDWANSAFQTTVIAAVFPRFFADYAAAGLSPAEAAARFAWAS